MNRMLTGGAVLNREPKVSAEWDCSGGKICARMDQKGILKFRGISHQRLIIVPGEMDAKNGTPSMTAAHPRSAGSQQTMPAGIRVAPSIGADLRTRTRAGRTRVGQEKRTEHDSAAQG